MKRFFLLFVLAFSTMLFSGVTYGNDYGDNIVMDVDVGGFDYSIIEADVISFGVSFNRDVSVFYDVSLRYINQPMQVVLNSLEPPFNIGMVENNLRPNIAAIFTSSGGLSDRAI